MQAMNTKTDKDQELSNCNFVKTVLMLLVVFYHCILYWGGAWFDRKPAVVSDVLSIVAEWLDSFHIYAFVLVSGYIFYHLKHECGKYDRFIPFALGKAKRLLVPFAFVAIIWVIPIQCVLLKSGFSEIVERYILGVSPSQLWFLLMLFGVFIFYFPFSNFFKMHNIGGALLAGAFYFCGILGQKFVPNAFQLLTACMYLPIFWIGFKLRQYKSGWWKKVPVLVWVFADILLFVISLCIADIEGIVFTALRLALNLSLHAVGAIMAFVCLGRIAGLVKWERNKAFRSLSRLTMPIYLFHQQFIYICLYFLNGLINPYLHAVLNFIISMACSIGISVLLMKFKSSRMLIGEK